MINIKNDDLNELLGIDDDNEESKVIKRIKKVSNDRKKQTSSNNYATVNKQSNVNNKYVMNPISRAKKSVSDGTNATKGNINDLRNISNNVRSKIGKEYSDFKEKGIKDYTKDKVKDSVYDEVGNIKDAANELKSGIKNKANDVKNKVGDEYSNIREKGIKNYAKDKVNDSVKREFERNKGELNDLKDGIKNGAKKVKQVSDKAKDVARTAKKGAEFVAKNGVKEAAKVGAKAAAGAAASAATAGIAAAAMLAKDVADKLTKKAREKINETSKKITGFKAKHLLAFGILGFMFGPIIIGVIVISLISVLTMSQVNLTSEDTYESIVAIVEEREKVFKKSLLYMSGDGEGFISKNWYTPFDDGDLVSSILLKDLEDTKDGIGPDKPGMFAENKIPISKLSIKTFLKDVSDSEYNEFMATKYSPNSNEEGDNINYKDKLELIRRYLLADRENFNMINWKIKGSEGEEEYIKKGDIDFIKNLFPLIKNPNSLKIPDPEKYKNKEVKYGEVIDRKLSSNEVDSLLKSYEYLVNKHLQHYVEPFALNITSVDNRFGLDVLYRMKHPIDITLYQLNRQCKSEERECYLKVKVEKFVINMYGEEPTKIDEFETTSDKLDQYKDEEGIFYKFEYLRDDRGGYIRADYVNSTPISVDTKEIKGYRNVPKLTYVEGLYKIINASYEVKSYDLSNAEGDSKEIAPIMKRNGPIGYETTWKYWDEHLEEKSKDEKTYKLSYLSEDDYDEDGKLKVSGDLITRQDWMYDYGKGKYEMYPSKDEDKNPRILPWFNKLYEDTIVFAENEPYRYLENGFEFENTDELKRFLELKYNEMPILNYEDYYNYSKDNENRLEVSKWVKKFLTYSHGDPMKALEIPRVQPYSYSDVYLAYDRIDQYVASVEKKLSSAMYNNGNFYNCRFVFPLEIDLSKEGSFKVTSKFTGSREHPIYHDVRPHTGVDLVPCFPDGDTYVIAADYGKVIMSTYNTQGYGNFIAIDHGNGVVTRYAHLQERFVEVGETVEKGQRIGIMGSTGDSTGPHLHFEVKINKEFVDPMTFFNEDGTPKGTGFSVVETSLTEDEFSDIAVSFASGVSDADASFKSEGSMRRFYQICKEKGVNPEYAYVTAYLESSFNNAQENYWGLNTPNGANTPRLGDMLTTLGLYCDTIIQYQDPTSENFRMIMQRFKERSEYVGENGERCDPMGYGTPDTISGIQSIYSNLGYHVKGDSGKGGYYYMDPDIAGVKRVYATHEEFETKCKNAGGKHAYGTVTTPDEQSRYTAWQVEGKINTAIKIFGPDAGRGANPNKEKEDKDKEDKEESSKESENK